MPNSLSGGVLTHTLGLLTLYKIRGPKSTSAEYETDRALKMRLTTSSFPLRRFEGFTLITTNQHPSIAQTV